MKTIYGIKTPNNTTCSEYVKFITFQDNIPQKHINSKKTYYNNYYFDNEKTCDIFYNSITNIIKETKNKKTNKNIAKLLNKAIRELEQDMQAENGEFDGYFIEIFEELEN